MTVEHHHVIGFLLGGVILLGAVALAIASPPKVHEGTFDTVCRNHVVGHEFASADADQRQIFFDKGACARWSDIQEFPPRATLYPLTKANEMVVYFAAFDNGNSIIAVK